MKVGANFISPWAKKAMIGDFFYNIFLKDFFKENSKVGTKFVSPWPTKSVIGWIFLNIILLNFLF